jgi:pyruvate,orthophosphate dikinase
VTVDLETRSIALRDGTTIAEGDTISLDGSTGAMYIGSLPVVDSPIVQWLEGAPPIGDLVEAVARLLAHADDVRRLRIRANADSGPDAARAVRFGAEGIGLCRTEHMFLGERRLLIERMILADDPEEQAAALAELLPVQRADFAEIFAAMDGRPVTIRLIDPPLHEFLPDLTELSVRVALDAPSDRVTDRDRRLLDAVRRHHEDNPMMGLRGVRLAIMVPDLVATQARAIFEAAADHQASGGTVDLEILVPLLITDRELAVVRSTIDEVADRVREERGSSVDYLVGAMIETPRAALTADRIAKLADFFSFGTNDLTQMTWGLSRDDGEGSFLPRYLDIGIVPTSPFQTIDADGVGRLVATATELARHARPGIELGVCGEHGGDPTSIDFFDGVGLDYVSCSPFRVPVARLEAGRAAIRHRTSEDGGGRP